MAALPKKKISKVRSKTRRGQIKATLTSLVKSKKFPGLSVPHRFRKYYDSLTATDKEIVRAGGASRKNLVSQTTKRVKSVAKKSVGIKPSKADSSTIANVKKSRKTASKAKMPEAGE